MLQIIVSVVSLQNGSRKAVSGTGITSMSDSLIACQPRMLEPSKPRPSSKVLSCSSPAGMVKCCQRPGKSMKRRSTALTSFSRIRARTSLGDTRDLLKETGTKQGADGYWNAPGWTSLIYGKTGRLARKKSVTSFDPVRPGQYPGEER